MAKKERDPELERIGRRVRLARKEKKLTLEKLAEDAETSVQFLSQVEKGEQSMTMVKFARLARALGVSADYLLYGDRKLGDRGALVAEYLGSMKPIEREMLGEMTIHFQRILDAIAPEHDW